MVLTLCNIKIRSADLSLITDRVLEILAPFVPVVVNHIIVKNKRRMDAATSA